MAVETAHRPYLQAAPRYFGVFVALLLGFSAFMKFRSSGNIVYINFSVNLELRTVRLVKLLVMASLVAAYHVISSTAMCTDNLLVLFN